MLTLIVICVLSFVVLGLTLAYNLTLDYYDEYPLPLAIIGVIAALVALVTGVMILIIVPSRAVGRNSCEKWSRQTNVPTKFVLLNTFDTGTCLAKTPDGHWVQNSNWYAYVGVNK